jgi:hypothetical protein
MTQAHANQKPTNLGAQAAAAATTGGTAKPSDAKTDAKTDAKPAPTPRKKAADMTPAEKEAAKAERLAKAKKVFIVVGTVHEFDSVNKAEKFLNAADSPAEYTAIRGLRIGTSKKVSLR